MNATQCFLAKLVADADRSSSQGQLRISIQQDNPFGRSFSASPHSLRDDLPSPRRASFTKGRWEDRDESKQSGESSCCCCRFQSLVLTQSNTVAPRDGQAQTSIRCTACPPTPPKRQGAGNCFPKTRKSCVYAPMQFEDHRWKNETPSFLPGEKGQEAPSLPTRHFE